MKLRIEYIDEDTGIRIVVKNVVDVVYYHNSDIHDEDEFEILTGHVFNGDDVELHLTRAFYKLAGELM